MPTSAGRLRRNRRSTNRRRVIGADESIGPSTAAISGTTGVTIAGPFLYSKWWVSPRSERADPKQQ